MATDAPAPAALEKGSRLLLALMIAVFGANKFLEFMEMPTPPGEGGQFLGSLMASGYIFPTIGVVFLVSALLLLMKKVVLPLLLLAPIAVNIIAYHLIYDPANIGAGAVLVALMLLVAWCHRAKLRSALL